jgi:general secretion pathway protein A
MYEKFYQFKKSPFRITPDPEFLYVSPSHMEAVASIVFGVEQRKGFIVVVGEVGVGKTTILRRYLARLGSRRLSTAYVFNANVGFKDLLDTICRELGVTDKPDDVAGMVNRLHQLVIEEYRQRRNVVIVIDEAQNMPIETLENLRVLSNLDTSTDKLVQIVLLGQPELADTLDRADLRQLKQRVAVRCTLSPYTDEESQAYIEHRLHTAGSSTSSVFTPSALRAIIKYGQGIPRRINVVCDSALVTGLGYQAKPVTAAVVREVIRDLEGKPRAARRWRARGVAAALLVMSAVLSVSAYRGFRLAGPSAEADTLIASPAPTAPATAALPETPSLTLPGGDGRRADAGWLIMNAAGPSAAEPPLVDTRVVRQGDTLLRMTMDVYGFPLESVFQRILERNPGISNVNWIQAGTTIRFPDVSDLRKREPRPTRGGQPTP